MDADYAAAFREANAKTWTQHARGMTSIAMR